MARREKSDRKTRISRGFPEGHDPSNPEEIGGIYNILNKTAASSGVQGLKWEPWPSPLGPGVPGPKPNIRMIPPVLGEMEVDALAKKIQEQQTEIDDLKKKSQSSKKNRSKKRKDVLSIFLQGPKSFLKKSNNY